MPRPSGPANQCPACGAVLRADELRGLCPACLLAAAGSVSGESTAERPAGAPAATSPRLVPEQRFGPYRIARFLGRGGMGEAYEAEHVEHGRVVALKVLATGLGSRDDRARFLREGRLAASVRHPNTDFGLSISAGVRNVDDSVRTGHFLGTPEFASPEQVRGEPLDVRSDIYAVGATLYALLTAQSPFEGRTLEDLFARITSQSPTAPGDTGRAIPLGLDAVVVRCLSKDAAERPSNYAELAALLQPFGSMAEEPSNPAARLAAGLSDTALLRFAVGLVGALGLLMTRDTAQPGTNWTIVTALAGALLYYGLSEWRAGASPGKCVMGLRVLRDDGQPVPARAAFARAAIFVVAVKVLPGFVHAAVASMMPAAVRHDRHRYLRPALTTNPDDEARGRHSANGRRRPCS